MGNEPTDDPGWPKPALLLLAVFPVLGLRIARRQLEGQGLLLLRLVFAGFSASIVLFAIVLAVIPSPRETHVMPWLGILIVVAIGSAITVVRSSTPLRCGSESELALSFRTRMFRVVAFTEIVALLAFVFTFIGGPRWIYDVGGAFTLLQLWTAQPPTKAAIRREQQALDARGCTLSLVAALNRQTWSFPGGS